MIGKANEWQCPDVDVVVIDEHGTRIALAVDDWDATTLLACVSEDPADWSQLAGVWPRYQIGPSVETLEELDFAEVGFKTAMANLSMQRAWIVIDLRTKRLCFGTENDPMERDGCYAVYEHGNSGAEFRIMVHLPPWWEFHSHVDLSMVSKPRQEELPVFQPRREVLWGPALAQGLAELMVAQLDQDPVLAEILASLSTDFTELATSSTVVDESMERLRELRKQVYEKTVTVHRDWLMTPRSDLDGRMPRQCLHGGMNWIGLVIEGQQWQVTTEASLTPLPKAMANNPNVPMGISEVCLYFDLCRELIESGWVHLSLRMDRVNRGRSNTDVEEFAFFLGNVQKGWMRMPHEDGDTPEKILSAERHRLPRMLDADHAAEIDCDCPICEMMKLGDFGPSFEGFDGHHLELDDEFAFSLIESREEWEESRLSAEGMFGLEDDNRDSDEAWMEIGDDDDDDDDDEDDPDEDDEFGSVWKSTYVSQDGIPGDTKGHIAISFLLADMMDTLRQLDAPNEVEELKQAFREYRAAGQYEMAFATEQFQGVLEQVAQRHSELVSRSADLQHRLDEIARRVEQLDSEDEFPNG